MYVKTLACKVCKHRGKHTVCTYRAGLKTCTYILTYVRTYVRTPTLWPHPPYVIQLFLSHPQEEQHDWLVVSPHHSPLSATQEKMAHMYIRMCIFGQSQSLTRTARNTGGVPHNTKHYRVQGCITSSKHKTQPTVE